MTAPRLFDPVTLDSLDGLKLIEASAGTGKTFNIATVFVRLLIEQDHPVAGRPLEVRDVLVVTFTEAATQELRERLRTRVVQARDLAEALRRGEAPPDDPGLAPILRLVERAPAGPEAVAERLRLAALSLDELAVFTIHGFCQRALAEHAFECGGLFQRGDIVSEGELREEVVRDLWRQRTVNAPTAAVRQWVQGFGSPKRLADRLAPLLSGKAARILPDLDEAEWETRAQTAMAAARRLLENERDAIEQTLSGLYRAGAYRETDAHLDAILTWLQAGDLDALPPEKLGEFTAETLQGKRVKQGFERPDHPCFEALGTLHGLLGLREGVRLRGLAEHVASELRRRKVERRCYSYDDMVHALAEALACPERGERLAESLYRRYPYAMVDEFQDTDPVQYRIFHRTYAPRQRGGLLMIGDPKQAIYSFRGGDIYAYIRAARDAAEQRYTLRHNHRSDPELIAAVNALFHGEDDATPAFLHRGIPFEPALDPDRPKPALMLDGERPAAPLTCWRFDSRDDGHCDGSASKRGLKVLKNDALEPALIRACVLEIHRWLTAGRTGRARLRGADGAERPVVPGDIAVLTRDNRQAVAMKAALDAAGIPSVCLQKDSVFATPEARDLARLLEAVAEPGHTERLRAALATDLLGATATQLDGLLRDPEAWEAETQRFQALRHTWSRHGVLSMLQPILTAAAPRLLARPDGQRRLTNCLHLGELLQEAGERHFGPHGLVRWLNRQILAAEDEGEAAEERQLRLETDEDLVQILTIHKSKGLQYGIVFAPFLCRGKLGGDTASADFHDPADPDEARVVDLGSDALEQHRRRQAWEELAEQVRLVYVALTRAVHRCYFAWGKANGAERSALAWLLHREDGCNEGGFRGPKGFPDLLELDPARLRARLDALRDAAGGRLEVVDLDLADVLDAPDPEPLAPMTETAGGGAARRLQRDIHDAWWTYSFSQLVRLGRGAVRAPDHARDDATADEDADPGAADGPIAVRPRGAGFGTCVHAVLEKLDFARADTADAERLVRQECRVAGIEDEGDQARVLALVRATLATTIALPEGPRLRLCELPPERRVPEMEFYFPLRRTPLPALAAALSEYPAYARTPEALSASADEWRGMMTGKIDLVFEHGGRFYLADYKSHALGTRYADYAPDALRRVAFEKQHDLQYLIYTVALHRHLGRHLPDYDYERHMGGALYLFVRGLRPEAPPNTGVLFDRPPAALIHALDRLFGHAEAPA